MIVVILKSQGMVIIKRPALTQSFVSSYVKIHCTDFHDCPLVRTLCFPQKGTGSIAVQGTMLPQPAQCPSGGKRKFSVSGDPVCNVHWDWATTTALPLGIHCSQNFLSKKVSQSLFGLFPPNIMVLPGSAICGFQVYQHFVPSEHLQPTAQASDATIPFMRQVARS